MDKDSLIKSENILQICIVTMTVTFSFQFLNIIYRKLKSINPFNKNVKKIESHQSHQVHQITGNIIMSTARRSNPFMRLITNFTGSCVTGNREDNHCLQTHILVHATKTKTQVTTAEAGSQVCEEILSKRERRSRLQSEIEEGDQTPKEGFIQEMFESSSSSSSCCGATQVDPKIQETHTCSVCLDELCIGNTNITTTACGHTFHLTCLLKSLTQKNLCPMCRGELEDVRTKQMPSNVLTPVSAEQIIAEEISYFAVGSHAHSIMLSQHPKRRVKEMLRVFGFTLLRTVAEFVHDENMPAGWFDDGNSESESESEYDDEEGSSIDSQGENHDDDHEDDDHEDDDNEDDDNEEEYSDNDANQEPENNQPIRGDLRDNIGW